MSILQRSTFVGTEHADVRPTAYTKTSVLDGLVKDQAYLYERITNLPVPNAPSLSASGHNHSGPGAGAIMRIPFCEQLLQASLPRRTAAPVSGGTDYAAFSDLITLPFFCPFGVDKIQCIMWVDDATIAERNSFRAVCQDSTFSQIGDYVSPSTVSWIESGVSESGLRGLVFTVDATPGQVCVLIVQAWDGAFSESVPPNESGELLGDRFIYGITVSPEIKRPNQQLLTLSDTSNSARTLLDLDGTFVSFDSTLVSDDIGLSSYHLSNIAKNDGVLSELATNLPAATESTISVDGHNHADGTSISASPGVGNEIPATLGAWFYGTVRPPPIEGTSSTNYTYRDVIGSGLFSNIWYGGTNAIALLLSASTNWQTAAYHLARIPASIAANLANGTGRLCLAALVDFDSSKATQMSVRASIGDYNNANYGPTITGTTVANGRDLIVIRGIQCTTSISGEKPCMVKVEIKNSVASTGAGFLLGCALYYEG